MGTREVARHLAWAHFPFTISSKRKDSVQTSREMRIIAASSVTSPAVVRTERLPPRSSVFNASNVQSPP